MSALALDLRALLLSVYPGDTFFELNVPDDPERQEAQERAIVYHRNMSAGEHGVAFLIETGLAKGYGTHADVVFELAPVEEFRRLDLSDPAFRKLVSVFLQFSDVMGIEGQIWEPFVVPERFQASFVEIRKLGITETIEGKTHWNDEASRFL